MLLPPLVGGQQQGYLAHKKQLPPLGPPYGPKHIPAVGSYGGAVSYERGTPVGSTPDRHWAQRLASYPPSHAIYVRGFAGF